MTIQATTAATTATRPIIIKIDATRNTQNNTFTSVWQGLQNMGYSEADIAKIHREMENEMINGQKFVATQVADGTAVDVSAAIARAGVSLPNFGKLTTSAPQTSNQPTQAPDTQPTVQPSQPTDEAQPSQEQPTENQPQNIQMYQGKPINVEPQTLSPETIMQNYGDNKVFQTARGMAHLSEANGGDRKITGKKYYQPWCADMVNYFYQQLLGTNPMAINGRNNSMVAGIKRWGINNGIYNKAGSLDKIQTQMGNLKPGDVIIFDTPHLYKAADGGVYRNGNISHTAVVVAVNNGKVVLMEGNTNERKMDANGNFITNKKGEIIPQSTVDGILFKEYDATALFCRGYSGFLNMQGYQ